MLYTYEKAQESLENLKDYLKSQGWVIAKTVDFKNTHVNWYAHKRLPECTSTCNCNGREPALCLYPWMLVFNTDKVRYSTSCEVELCATATPDNHMNEAYTQDWVQLKYYSIKPEDIPKKLPKITEALTKAWEAIWIVEVQEI